MAWAVIGWPVVAAAIAAFGVAFSTRYSWAGFAGALIAAPLCLYLKDLPYLQWVSLAALAANFVSAVLFWRGRRDIAFTLLLPFNDRDRTDRDPLDSGLLGVQRPPNLIGT